LPENPATKAVPTKTTIQNFKTFILMPPFFPGFRA